MSDTPRVESILRAMIDGVEYTDPPQSRLESLLLELKDTIETEGGGVPQSVLEQIQQNTADISDLGTDKQDKTDNTLATTAKTVTGAINELAGDVGDIQSVIPSTATPSNPLLDTASSAITATATASPINGSATPPFLPVCDLVSYLQFADNIIYG